MIYPIAAVLILWFLISRVGVRSGLIFRVMQQFAGKTASIVAVLAALFVLIRGNVWLALVLFGLALWLLGRATRASTPSAAPPRRDKVSRLRSAMIEMDWDQHTGHLSGTVIAGPFEGSALAALDRDQCGRVYLASLKEDADGARFLEAYFDRRFPGWRGTGYRHANTRESRTESPARMSEDEAYEVLGLGRGASRDEIVRTHRRVMKKWHPDQGGSADLAARANEAKEVLLRRHARYS